MVGSGIPPGRRRGDRREVLQVEGIQILATQTKKKKTQQPQKRPTTHKHADNSMKSKKGKIRALSAGNCQEGEGLQWITEEWGSQKSRANRRKAIETP